MRLLNHSERMWIVQDSLGTVGRLRSVQVNRRLMLGLFVTTFGSVVALLSYLVWIVPLVAMGLAATILGVLIIYLPESDMVPSYLATSSTAPSMVSIERLMEDLDLQENGIYIPATESDASPKVFLPLALTASSTQPPLALGHTARMFVSAGGRPEERGILLDAPGSEILTQLEKVLRIDFSKTKPDELAVKMKSGLAILGIAKNFEFELNNNVANISLNLLALTDLETKLRTLAPRLVAQVGTPVASAIAATVSKTTGSYVTLTRTTFDPSKKTMTIRLELRQSKQTAQQQAPSI